MAKAEAVELGEGSIDRYTDGTYLQHNQTWHVEDSPWKARHIEELLARNRLTPSTVCEIGCGAGEILRQLSLNTTQTRYVGYELSPQAFELCQTRQGDRLAFFHQNLLDVDGRYDCLLCIDVFEHVDDYLGFLRALRPKATYKVFHIPLDVSLLSIVRNSIMIVRNRLGHLHYFTQETAMATLKDCGYEIVDGFYTASFDLPEKSWKAWIAFLPRWLLFKISPRWTARLLGRCSYMVLTR